MVSIDILLRSIVITYFSNSRCLNVITDELNPINLQVAIPTLYLNSQKFENLFNYSGCQAFILDAKYPETVFRGIEQQIKLHPDRFNRRKYVFVPRANQRENPLNVFKSNEIHFVSDLLVIHEENRSKDTNTFYDKNEEIYSLWTHKYVGESDNYKAYMLDKWYGQNESFLFHNNLFPNKLRQQEGRIFKAAVFPYEPYVIIEPKGNGSYLYMGAEMVALATFAEHLNLTLMPVINDVDYWGKIWENWSGNGLLGNLVEDNADVGGAALFQSIHNYWFLDMTKPTIRTGVTCLVPAPKPVAGWLTPVYAYHPLTWMAVMGMFITNLLVLYFLNILRLSVESQMSCETKLKVFGKTLISVSKPFIMQSVTSKEISQGLLERYLMGLVFITTLILSTTFDSGLAAVMTIPRYEKPINTVAEFIASGLHWGWLVAPIQNVPTLTQVLSRFVKTSEENLRELSLTGEFAFYVERLPDDHYAIGPYIQEDVIQNFYVMKEDFYWEQCVFMLRKSSILLPYLDIFVLRVFETGLIWFWQNEAATKYMNQYIQKAVKKSYNQQQRQNLRLQMIHVQGAFGVLVVGESIALAVFITELLYYRICQKVVWPH